MQNRYCTFLLLSLLLTAPLDVAASEHGTATGTISGKVLQADGVTGVAGAEVGAADEGSMTVVAVATTGADGSYVLTVEAGVYAVFAAIGEDFHGAVENVTVTEGQNTVVNILPSAEPEEPEDPPSGPTGTISGKVLLADGVTGVEGAQVGAADESSMTVVAVATTGADGSYVLTVEVGVYTVFAAIGEDFHGSVENVTVTEGQTTVVNILPSAAPPIEPPGGPGIEGFPMCADDASGSCIQSLSVLSGGQPGSMPIPVVFDTGNLLQVQLWASENGAGDLVDIGAGSTGFEIVLELRGFTPRLLLGAGGGLDWNLSTKSDHTEVTIQTSPISIERIWPVDYDNWPQGADDKATQSVAAEIGLAISNLDHEGITPEDADLLNGTILATDAQSFGNPQYHAANGENPAELSIFLAGPHFTVNGAENQGFFEAFLPDALLTAWGVTDPSDLTAAFNDSGSLSAFSAGGGMRLQLNIHYSSGDVRISSRKEATHRGTEELPSAFEIAQNYPNPFNPSTQITYAVPRSTEVRLEVFNALGHRVAVLVDRWQDAGRHTATFDASGLASGTYFYRLAAENFAETKTMVLVR